jgi:hypothetical protein
MCCVCARSSDWGDSLPAESADAFCRFIAGAFEAWGPPAPGGGGRGGAAAGGLIDGGGTAAPAAAVEPGRWSGAVVAALAPRGEWGTRTIVRPAPPSSARVYTSLAVLLAKMSEQRYARVRSSSSSSSSSGGGS